VSAKYGLENERQSTEIDLKTEVQTGSVTGDIYNVQNRLENVNKRIESSQRITPHNRELIWKFCDHCRLQGLSTLRVVFYLNRFWNIARLATKNFDEMTKEDVQRLVMALRELRKRNGEPLSERTTADHLVAIKTFWKWLKDSENEFPPEVRWIKACCRGTHFKLPDDLPSADDVQKLIDTATNARDKAFISMLYDSGGRIGEILSLQRKNISFDESGAVVLMEGKTGQRRDRLILSVPFLSQWLSDHPDKRPDAPVWVHIGRGCHEDGIVPLDYYSARKILQRLKVKAGIKKAVNPHAFRHARATQLAGKLTEAQMKQIFGWTQDSRMAGRYVHLSGRDVDEAMLRAHGLRPKPEDEKPKLTIVKCVRCEQQNSTILKFCSRCGMPLDLKAALELEGTRKKADEIMSNLLEDQEVQNLLRRKLRQVELIKPS